jgi:hypothetical protein
MERTSFLETAHEPISIPDRQSSSELIQKDNTFFDLLISLYPQHREVIEKYKAASDDLFKLLFYLRTNSGQARDEPSTIHEVDIVQFPNHEFWKHEYDECCFGWRQSDYIVKAYTQTNIQPKPKPVVADPKVVRAQAILDRIRENPAMTAEELAKLL